MTFFALYRSPFGSLLLKSDGRRLQSLRFASEATEVPPPACPVLGRALEALDAYFEGDADAPARFPDELLEFSGAPSVQAMHRLLRRLPAGAVCTYGELARAAASEGFGAHPRLAGRAMACNELMIFVPCHRVVPADSVLGNYSGGGPSVKAALLRLEGCTFHSRGSKLFVHPAVPREAAEAALRGEPI